MAQSNVTLKERYLAMLYELPTYLELHLKDIGVLPPPAPSEPVIERDFSFKMPVLDENGEPDF
jgi:hypothetical protein